MAATIMSANQRQRFKDAQELDLAYSVPGLGRFRCNVFQQRGTVGIVLRVIPQGVRRSRSSTCRRCCEKICRGAARPGPGHRHHRLRQVDDAGGDDRLHQQHARRAHHHHRGPDRVPAPRQEVDRQPARGRQSTPARSPTPCAARCARTPTSSWSARCATRDDRDRAHAAETGHLVFSTLHTLDATETINRIISVFPPHQQKQVRLQLASVLKAVVAQRLIPRADGSGRVPAVEVLIATPFVRDCIVNKEKTQAHPGRDRAGHRRSTGCRPSTSRSSASTSRS